MSTVIIRQFYAIITSMSNWNKLVLDIETVGEDFDSLDKATKENLTHWIKKESESEEEYRQSLEELKGRLGFSPLTAEIAAIGVLDCGKDEGVVYYQAPGEKAKESKEGNMTFKPYPEKEMLEKFWEGAKSYNYFITFNGRAFDIPFLMIRSAIHGVKPTKDLMRGRYFSQQNFDAVHVDLFDQFTFFGAVRRKGSLHLWSRAFGITSPKAGGVTGDDVGRLFAEKRFLELAKYNAGDLRATKELHDRWENYLKF